MPTKEIGSHIEEAAGVRLEEHRVECEAMSRENALSRFRDWGYDHTPSSEPSMYTIRDLDVAGSHKYRATVIIASGDQSKFPQIQEAI